MKYPFDHFTIFGYRISNKVELLFQWEEALCPSPQHPTMTAYPKVHKVPVKARPVISHRNTPMSRSCKWAADILSPYVGRISTAHILDTRDFHTRVSRSKARGRLVSLDVRSLYTNIPVAEAIDVIREHSTGTNPTFKDTHRSINLL